MKKNFTSLAYLQNYRRLNIITRASSQNSNCPLFLYTSTRKIRWRSDDPRTSYCAFSIFKKILFSKWRPSTILDLVWRHIEPSRLVLDGPNILLKLHVDRIYTLQDIAIFIFDRFDLKLPIHAPFGEFWGILPQMNSDIVATAKRTVVGRKHVV